MRPVLLALATALLFVVPAAAADGAKELRGSIAALSAKAITVKDGTKSATCSVVRTSPPLVEYSVGDRVAVVCKRTGDRWTLLAIHKLVTKPKADQPAPKKTPPATDGSFKQGGKLTSVSATSVTVRDGDHDFVCQRGDASPPLDGFTVGDHVVIVCKGGALVGITRVEVPSPTEPKDPTTPTTPKPEEPTPPVVLRSGQGTVSALTDHALTVHTDGGDVSCALGDGSPKLGDYHVGDRVKFYCKNDVLAGIVKAETPTPPVVERTGQGTISALTDHALTVHTDGGDVTCSLGDGSPKLGDYHVGDLVKFYCKNDALVAIYKTETPKPAPVIRSGLGKISALSTSAVTVHTDGGEVTCKLGEKSPNLGEFRVGDYVKFYCTDNVLSGLARL
jgi:hypothetical protein